MGAWRSTRWFLLVAGVGGVLAADNSWVNPIKVSLANAAGWFSNDTDSPDSLAVFSDAAESDRDYRNSMGRLLNGVLFSRPSGSWSLVTAPSGSAPRQMDYAGAADSARPLRFIDPDAFNGASDFSRGFVGGKTSIAIVKDNDSPNVIITSGTGTWTADSDGDWGDASKWASSEVPDGAGTTADFSTVNITADRDVVLDFSRTVGNLTIGDTDGSNSWTLRADPNAVLTFSHTNSGFTGILTQTANSGGDTISAPISIGNVNYLSVTNNSPNTFTLSGPISSSSGNKVIQFEAGRIEVSGVISNGGAGNSVSVGVTGGTTILSGTNTYSGYTTVIGGTLLINGDNSGANGSVSVANTGTLGGTGTIGGPVGVGGSGAVGGTITGGTTTDVGTLTIGSLTLNQNVSFNPGEGNTRYLVNLDGAFSDNLLIFGNLNISGNSHLHFEGMANGTTTYTLAEYLGHTGSFIVDNLPSGYDLVYGSNALLLVPTAIPEPATWIGGALALGVAFFAARKRKTLRS